MPRLPVVPLARAALLLISLAMSGCGESPDGKPNAPEEAPALVINQEAGTAFTNGDFFISVRALRSTPEAVELLLNGELLTTLRPPFQFSWDSSQVAEGLYYFQARAQWKGQPLLSARQDVMVDRTRPTVVWKVPTGRIRAGLATALEVTFSEAVRFKDARGLTAIVRVGGREQSTRMTLSEDRRTLSARIDKPEVLPSEDSAVVPLEFIRDLAGNPVAHEDSTGGTLTWSWESPLFYPEYRAWPRPPPVLGQRPPLVPDRLALVVGLDGAPVVALAHPYGHGPNGEAGRGAGIVVRRLEDEAWRDLGVPVIAQGGAQEAVLSHPRLALGEEGRPVLAFQQRDAANASPDLYVLQWTTDTWAPLGARLNAPDEAELHSTALAVDREGRPLVAWSAADGIRVRRWDGGRWAPMGDVQRVGSGAGASVSAQAPALSVDASGGVHLAWAEAESSDVGAGLYVRSWSGSGWDAVGGRLSHEARDVQNYHVTEPSLATMPDGRLVAAWLETDAVRYHRKVVVAQWSGVAWDLRVVTSEPHRLPGRERDWPSLAVNADGQVMVTFLWGDSATGIYMNWHRQNAYSTDLVTEVAPSTPAVMVVDREGKPVIAYASSGLLNDEWGVTLVYVNE